VKTPSPFSLSPYRISSSPAAAYFEVSRVHFFTPSILIRIFWFFPLYPLAIRTKYDWFLFSLSSFCHQLVTGLCVGLNRFMCVRSLETVNGTSIIVLNFIFPLIIIINGGRRSYVDFGRWNPVFLLRNLSVGNLARAAEWNTTATTTDQRLEFSELIQQVRMQ